MNDPMEHCTYNSDTIFQIFYGESEPVSDYYVVAAALRNYFLDQYSYDYSAQQLYDMFKKSTLLTENQSLEEIVYELMEFKTDRRGALTVTRIIGKKKEANGKTTCENLP